MCLGASSVRRCPHAHEGRAATQVAGLRDCNTHVSIRIHYEVNALVCTFLRLEMPFSSLCKDGLRSRTTLATSPAHELTHLFPRIWQSASSGVIFPPMADLRKQPAQYTSPDHHPTKEKALG